MPAKITKVGKKFKVSTPNGVHAKGTTKAKAESQQRLLNAIDHGWEPDQKKRKVNTKTAGLLKGFGCALLGFLLYGTPIHASQIIFTWGLAVANPEHLDPEGYIVSRHDTTSTTFVEVCRVAAPTRSCSDTVSSLQVYTYHVVAYTGAAVSQPSNELSVILPATPGDPQNLDACVVSE